MSAQTREFRDFALAAAKHAAAVANYCDHVEHNEATTTGWVTGSGDALRQLALDFAADINLDLIAAYGKRLALIEAKNVLAGPDSFDGESAVSHAQTWRDLQLVQADHDRAYHADVVGLAKVEQLRHYALHLTKIVGAFAECAVGSGDIEAIRSRRLPDTLLLAIKLHTVMGVRLSDEALSRRSVSTEPVAARRPLEKTRF